MKIKIYFFIFFSFILVSNAQYWEKITNLPPIYRNGYYLDIFFLPSNTNYIWACGFDGYVIRSTNYGTSWQGVTVPSPAYHLENIQFVNTTTGYVSGVEGIWKSTDGGASFFNVTPLDSAILGFWGSYFLDANVGVLLGGGCDDLQRFYKTTNGGTSWTLFTTKVPNSGLTDLILYSDGTGYAVSSGYLWKTTDTGSTWSVFKSTGQHVWQEEITIFGNSFVLPMAGVTCSGAGGGGGMNFSADGGNNFKSFYSGYPMFGAALTSPNTAWAAGYNRSVFYTSDGGSNWYLRNCGIDQVDLDDITFLSPTAGWVCGQGVYKLSPTKITASKDTLNFGEICFPDTRRDSLKIVNLSFYPADLQVSIVNNFDNAFSIISPTFNSQVFECDSNGIIVKFAPPGNNYYTAKLILSAVSGDGSTTFYKEVALVGTGNKSTIRSEKTNLIFDSVVCNQPKTVDFKWFSDNYSEQIKSYSELKDDQGQISFITTLPTYVLPGGTNTQFRILLSDTGWVSQDYKFILLPCNTDTIIHISAYGVSPIIHSIDSLHFVTRCAGERIDTIPIRNTGNAPLIISNSYIVGNPAEVKILGWTSKKTEPVTIPIKSSDSVIISFAPKLLNASSYQLKLVNNDVTTKRGNQNPLTILLVGWKESELINYKDTIIDLKTVCINSVKDTIINFENKGNIQALVKLQNQVQNPFSVKLPWNFSINPKETSSFTVTFSPVAPGKFTDSLIFKTGECNYLRILLKGIGIESKLTVNPTGISGTLKSNEVKDFNILVKNIGNELVNIKSYSLVPSTTNFTINLTPNLTQSLDIDQQINFTLSVLSTKNAYYKGSLCFDAGGQCPTNICLPIELISIDRYLVMDDSLDFGLSKCTGFKIDTIWVKNSGTAVDSIISAELNGDPEITLLGFTYSPPVIQPQDSIGIIIKFETKQEGKYFSTLQVSSFNPDGQILETQLSSEFQKSVVSVSPSEINFGEFEKCNSDSTVTILISNEGMLDEDLLVYDSDIPNGFTINNFNKISVSGKNFVNVQITFSPSLTNLKGLISGHIYWVTSNCKDTIKFKFSATILEPKLTYSSKSINFGSVWVDDTKNDFITVSNSSTVPRTITSVKSLSLPEFKLITKLPISILPSTNQDIAFSFNPKQPGNYSDSIIIEESSICKDTLTIKLNGITPSEQYKAEILIGDYKANPGDTVNLEVTLNPKLDRVFPDSMNLNISFDKYLIYPVQVLLQTAPKSYSNHSFEYKNNSLSIGLNSNEAQDFFILADTVIKIKSYILASNPTYTPLSIDSILVYTKKDLTLTKRDGSLTLNPICAPEAEHHIKLFLESTFKIINYPIGNSLTKIKFENITDGQILEIYNYLGEKVTYIPLNKGSYTQEFDFSNFAQGLYFLYLKPSYQDVQKLIYQN